MQQQYGVDKASSWRSRNRSVKRFWQVGRCAAASCTLGSTYTYTYTSYAVLASSQLGLTGVQPGRDQAVELPQLLAFLHDGRQNRRGVGLIVLRHRRRSLESAGGPNQPVVRSLPRKAQAPQQLAEPLRPAKERG